MELQNIGMRSHCFRHTHVTRFRHLFDPEGLRVLKPNKKRGSPRTAPLGCRIESPSRRAWRCAEETIGRGGHAVPDPYGHHAGLRGDPRDPSENPVGPLGHPAGRCADPVDLVGDLPDLLASPVGRP